MGPAALVARLQRRRRMREPILPPPPSARIAAWALLNVFWFRVVNVLVQRLGATVRAACRGADLLGPATVPPPALAALARERQLGSLLGRLAHDRAACATAPTSWATVPAHRPSRDERPTAVEVRRPG